MKSNITQIGFENNNVIAFYRTSKHATRWTQMQAYRVRRYWYKIIYERMSDIMKNIHHKVTFYDEL